MSNVNISKIIKIANKFNLPCEISSVSPIGNGHINDTFLISVVSSEEKFVLQRINHTIFKSPENLIENIERVILHLRKKISASNGDPTRETLTFMPVRCENSQYKYMYIAPEGEYYRVYRYIKDTVTYNKATVTLFRQSGLAFGLFAARLSDFDASSLHEVIPNFHNTRSRFDDLQKSIALDKMGRAASIQELIGFVSKHKNLITVLQDANLPVRVTHNDTKLNNVMFDKASGEAICVIDLDTVMPGLALYDFGDAIRFGASSAEEDEQDLGRVSVDLELFEAFTGGYLHHMRNVLTLGEIDLLATSAQVLTFECGIRFLKDYLDGDIYFKADFPEHNLVRAKTQFKLVCDMEQKFSEMKKIVEKFCNL